MIRVPLTCLTRSSSLTGCLAVLPSTYLYHLKKWRTEIRLRYTVKHVFRNRIESQRMSKVHLLFFVFFFFFVFVFRFKRYRTKGRGKFYPVEDTREIPVDRHWESCCIAGKISLTLHSSYGDETAFDFAAGCTRCDIWTWFFWYLKKNEKPNSWFVFFFRKKNKQNNNKTKTRPTTCGALLHDEDSWRFNIVKSDIVRRRMSRFHQWENNDTNKVHPIRPQLPWHSNKKQKTKKQQRDWFVFVQLPMTRWRMRLGIADNGNRTVATPSNRIKFRFGWQSRRYATHRLCLAYDRHHYYLPPLSSLIT